MPSLKSNSVATSKALFFRLLGLRAPHLGVIVAVTCLALGLWGCRASAPNTSLIAEDATVQTLAVMPFKNMYRIYGETLSFNCPLCGSAYRIGHVADGAEIFLSDKLLSELQQHPDLILFPPAQVQSIMSGVPEQSPQQQSALRLVLQIGQTLEADAVLLCRVYRFIERDGTAFAINSPASVAFDLLLIRTVDGRIIWTGQFDETQKTLSENLLNLGTFIQRRGRWITAEEMATTGIKDMLKSFPFPPAGS